MEAKPESIGAVRRAVVEYAVANGADGRASDVELAVSEAVTNAVRHGYPGDPGRIEVSATITDDEMTVIVEDDGGGLHAISHDPGPGFGRLLMQRLADEFALEDTGSGARARMRFRL